MRINGQYEAQIRIDFCEEDVDLPFDKVQEHIDKLADEICEMLNNELMLGEQSTITVTKIQADIWEVQK